MCGHNPRWKVNILVLLYYFGTTLVYSGVKSSNKILVKEVERKCLQ